MRTFCAIGVIFLLLAGVAWAQPVDLGCTLPKLIGKTNEEVEAALGRPHDFDQGRTHLTYQYFCWGKQRVEISFWPQDGKWVAISFHYEWRSHDLGYMDPRCNQGYQRP